MSLVDEAREFAIKAHGDQKYGDLPYITHLDDVAGVLKEFCCGGELELTLAYLHDVLEDCPLYKEELVKEFGGDIYTLVEFLTDEEGLTRKERKRETYARVIRQIVLWESFFPTGTGLHIKQSAAVRVKVADRLANIRRSVGTDLFKMYKKEREVFRLAYYSEDVCEAMWEEYDRLLG